MLNICYHVRKISRQNQRKQSQNLKASDIRSYFSNCRSNSTKSVKANYSKDIDVPNSTPCIAEDSTPLSFSNKDDQRIGADILDQALNKELTIKQEDLLHQSNVDKNSTNIYLDNISHGANSDSQFLSSNPDECLLHSEIVFKEESINVHEGENNEGNGEMSLDICISDVRTEATNHDNQLVDNSINHTASDHEEMFSLHQKEHIDDRDGDSPVSKCSKLCESVGKNETINYIPDIVSSICTKNIEKSLASNSEKEGFTEERSIKTSRRKQTFSNPIMFNGSQTCSICNKFFGSFRAYRVHVERKHEDVDGCNTKAYDREKICDSELPSIQHNQRNVQLAQKHADVVYSNIITQEREEPYHSEPHISQNNETNVVCIIVNDRKQPNNYETGEVNIVRALCQKGTTHNGKEGDYRLEPENSRNVYENKDIPTLQKQTQVEHTPKVNPTFESIQIPKEPYDVDNDDSGIFMCDQPEELGERQWSSTEDIYDLHLGCREPNLKSFGDLAKMSIPVNSNLTPEFKKMEIDKCTWNAEGSLKDLNLSNLFKAKRAIPELCDDISPKPSNAKEVGCEVCGCNTTSVNELEEHIKKHHSEVKDKVRLSIQLSKLVVFTFFMETMKLS